MAGCSCEDENKLNQDVSDHITNKLVTTSHMDVGSARNAAQIMVDFRRSVNEKYKEHDEKGVEGIGPEFEFTSDGDIYFTEFDDRLSEMYERQKTLRPKDYNKDEHDTVLSSYKTLKDGANQVAHIVHHFNEKGELDVRDVVILTYDHQTNRGRMHVLNISERGKNHKTLESAHEAMQQRLGGFKEEAKIDGVFLFVRKEIPVDPVSLFLKKTETFSMNQHLQTAKDVLPVVRTPFDADKTHDGIPFILPKFLQRLMGRDENGKLMKKEKPTKKKGKTIIVYDNGHKEIQRSKSLKETSSVVSRIEQQKEKVDEKKKSIAFAQQTGVGVGGALFLLDALTQSVPPLTRNEKREIRKTRRRVKREDTRLAPIPLRESGPIKVPSRKEIKKLRNKEKRRKQDKDLKIHSEGEVRKQRTKNKEKLRIIFSLKERKNATASIEKRKKKNIWVRAKEAGLLTALRKITRKIRFEDQQTIKKSEKKIRRYRKENKDRQKWEESVRKVALEFIRAWVLFALLKYDFHERPSLESTGNVVFRKKIGKEEQSFHESSPWILLSIIWHMTMIREQGKAIISPKKKKKKNNRKMRSKVLYKRNSHWPSRHGLIYAYNS